MELVSTIEIGGEEREIADAYAREQIDGINSNLMDLKMLGWFVPKECPVQNYVDSDGVFHQRVDRVDLGSLSWKYNDFWNGVFSTSKIGHNYNTGYGVCYKYNTVYSAEPNNDKWIYLKNNGTTIYIKDNSYSGDVTAFKQAMQGVYLYYELVEEILIKVDGNEAATKVNESLSVVGKCKNLLNPSNLGTTVMGITCTNNGDGTYALNGTATADLDLCIKGFKNLQLNKEYKMLGCPSGGSDSTYMLYDSSESDIKDIGKGKVYTPTKQPNINIRIMNGVTVNNLVFKPMLTTNLSATYDDFVPYTGDGETLTADVSELKNDLGGLSFSVSGTTLSITDGTNTWTLSK